MARNRPIRLGLLALLLTLISPAFTRAQGGPGRPAALIAPRLQPEARAVVGAARGTSIGVGLGFNVPAGYYVRIASMAGTARSLGSNPERTVRADVVGRFSFDPFRESAWGPYAGAGFGVEWQRHHRGRPAMVLAIGTDLPGASGWRPSVELAFGGGLRAAVALKPVRRRGR